MTKHNSLNSLKLSSVTVAYLNTLAIYYMYKGFVLHNHRLKFRHVKDITKLDTPDWKVV